MEERDYKVESIFMLKTYDYQGRLRFPMFKIHSYEQKLFKTLEEAEEEVRWHGEMEVKFQKEHPDRPLLHHYAYVITELILERPFNYSILGDCLSERVYLPDGTLWCKNDYGSFIPHDTFGPDEYNYWGRRNIFHGRRPEEIRFKPGDLVEVFGYPSNHFWSSGEVNLAIVVNTPKSDTEIKRLMEEYKATHSGHDLCDHSLSHAFGYYQDSYEILCTYGSDHTPTIATFAPSLPISTRMRNKFKKLYDDYQNEKEQNK